MCIGDSLFVSLLFNNYFLISSVVMLVGLFFFFLVGEVEVVSKLIVDSKIINVMIQNFVGVVGKYYF